MAGSTFNLEGIANHIEKALPSREYTLGKGLLQPFNDTNSGSRKIMQAIQKEQSIQLCKSETAIISTGAENRYGELSSTFIRAESPYMVIDKIPRNKNQYTALLLDKEHNILTCLLRTNYEYYTESYGIDLNPSGIDDFNKGDIIPEGTVLSKSTSFDSANNKEDGVNLATVYMAVGYTTEDPIVLSESAAKKLTSPLFNIYEITINENDIPLNMYGDNNYYKAFPDIGEEVKNGCLAVIRREKKDDEALYAQSRERLRERMISDTSYVAKGKVVDVEVFCNNPEKLNEMYFNQIKSYYDKSIEYAIHLYQAIDSFTNAHPSVQISYDLQKEFRRCKDLADGVPHIKEKVFNNIILRIVTREERVLEQGDKITDRYGGKGVVSKILPDSEMPQYFRNGEYHPIEAIYNNSTIINRLNPGQSFETEITWVGEKLLEYISSFYFPAKNSYLNGNSMSMYDALNKAEEYILRYLNIISKDYASDFHNIIHQMPMDERIYQMDSLLESGDIPIVIVPMKDEVNIETLQKLYEEFPFQEEYLLVNMKDSRGNIRKVKTYRPVIVGKKYIYRLKQLAEEKFSAVSLASTNIRGENTKTKANKMHVSPIAKTPVRLGGMEASELMQLPRPEYAVESLMLLSTSSAARRSFKKLLLGDPFDRNIELDENAKSRNVEIANAYLKCLGLKLEFTKVEPKVKQIFIEEPFKVYDFKPTTIQPITFGEPVGLSKEAISTAINKLKEIYYSNDMEKYGEIKIPDFAKSNPAYYRYNLMMESVNDALKHLVSVSNNDKELLDNLKRIETVRRKIRPVLFKLFDTVQR